MITIKDYGPQVDPDPAKARAELEAQHGQVWDTAELAKDFDVLGFSMGCVVVVRKADEQRGSLDFSHNPRLYFGFVKG